jgi:hypothetical protein
LKNDASAQRYGSKGVSPSEEWWNEPEAILLLERTGKLVQAIESLGKRMPQSARKLYHARLVAAHDAQDMAAYRIALEEYADGARKAHRTPKGE